MESAPASTGKTPPSSSHVMMMAVSFQYWLVPIPFTTDATHDGPEPSLPPAWSEEVFVGITQLTAARLPWLISSSTCVVLITTWFFHSAPTQFIPFGGGASGPHICRIAFGPVQMEPARGV